MRFEESLIQICISKLEDTARRINELRKIHVDENYEGNIKLLVAKEIQEKIDEYFHVWNILKDYFDEKTIQGYAPTLDDINSILWSKEHDEKFEPQEGLDLILESIDLSSIEPIDILQSQDEDIDTPDLFKALTDIDLKTELTFEEYNLLSLQEEKTISPQISEPTFIEPDPIKSFQEFYSKILDKKRLFEIDSSKDEKDLKVSSKELDEKIKLMKQYRDYVYKLSPRLKKDENENEEPHIASEIESPIDTTIHPINAKERNHKLKYYTIEQNSDSSEVTNSVPDLAVYHFTNNITEKQDIVDTVDYELETDALEDNLSVSDIQETKITPVIGNIIKDVSLVFGIMLFTSGIYVVLTSILPLSDIKSTEATIQILYSIIDQLPGVPLSINYLSNSDNITLGLAVITVGIMTVVMSVGLIKNINIARSIGALLYIFAAMLDVMDILYYGSIASPINILVFIINLVIFGVFLKDEFWIHHI